MIAVTYVAIKGSDVLDNTSVSRVGNAHSCMGEWQFPAITSLIRSSALWKELIQKIKEFKTFV